MKKLVQVVLVVVFSLFMALSVFAQSPVSGENDMLSNYALRKLNSEKAVVAVDFLEIAPGKKIEVATVEITETKMISGSNVLVTSTLRLSEVGPQLSEAAQLPEPGMAFIMPKNIEEAAKFFNVDPQIVFAVDSPDSDIIYGWVIKASVETTVTVVSGVCVDYSYSNAKSVGANWTVLMDSHDWARSRMGDGTIILLPETQATFYVAGYCEQAGGELISYDSDWMATLP